MKICRICNLEKDSSEFYTRKSHKDGLDTLCKVCSGKSAKISYEKNKDKYAKANKEWHANNAERRAASKRLWAKNNPDKIREHNKNNQWRFRNLEDHKKRNAEYRDKNRESINLKARQYKAINKEKIKNQNSAYRLNNLGKFAALSAKYRAKKLQRTPAWADLEAIKDVYLEAQYFHLDVDHIIPLQGELVSGLHVWDNLQLLTRSSNSSKSNKFDVAGDLHCVGM